MSTVTLKHSRTGAGDELLGELIEEVSRQLEAGEAVDLDAFIAAHPERAETLRLVLPALVVLADLGRSAVREPHACFVRESPDGTGLGELGDFRIIREVGRGGMGVVYEALQISLRRRVALKVLPFAAAMDPTQLRRFQTEALAAAQLHHTNIVPVYSVGSERGVHYYAMQFIDGQTLAAVIQECRRSEGGVDPHPPLRGTFSPGEKNEKISLPPGEGGRRPGEGQLETGSAERKAGQLAPVRPGAATPAPSRTREFFRLVAELGIQAAEALDYAHKVGIIHRDIKPANLLLDEAGKLWITDFGLARFQEDTGLTMTGDMLGTLRYMSPEQALAKRGYLDHRTDIYSLGVTLYEMLTLRPAIDGQDRQELLRRIAQEEPTPPRRLNPSIPRELETILLKAMNKEPESRYATAQELADDLKRFLEEEPIRAKRPTLLERATKWSRRHATAVGAAALVLLVAAVGLAVSNGIIARRNAEISRKNGEIVQQAERIKGALAESEAARDQAESVSKFLVDAFQRPDPDRDGRELKVVELLTSAATRLDTEFAGSPKIKGELLNAIGVTLDKLGLPMRAAEILEKALAVRQVALGPIHHSTLATGNSLGEACLAAGRTARALNLFQAMLKVRESTLGPDHNDTLECQSNLAMALAKVGDLTKAIPLFERTLQAQKSNLGIDHYDTLTTQNNYASTLSEAGRNEEALALFEATLKGYEATLGPDHTATLRGRNNLAFALTRVGRSPEAIPLLEKTLKLRESKLGPDHPNTVASLVNLATAYTYARDPMHAMPLIKLALERKSRKLGPDHPETLGAQIALGRLYQQTRHPAVAARLLEDALRRAGGRPDAMKFTEGVEREIQFAYYDSGQYAKSEPYARELLAKSRMSYGRESRHTLSWMLGLGLVMLKQQKWTEVEPILREALEVAQKTTPDAWSTFVARSALGESLLGMRQYAGAEPLILSGYEGLKARAATIPPQFDFHLMEAAERVVLLYRILNQPARAQAMLRSEDLDAMMPNGAAAFAARSADGKEDDTPPRSKP